MSIPLITAKPTPFASYQGRGHERRAMPWEALCLLRRHGPVTTDPFGVRLRSCQTRWLCWRGMTNLWPGQDAGSPHDLVDLPSYISGYVDGEGCFTVSISPRPALLVRWEVRPSISVSQNGDRSEVLLAMQRYFGCGTLRPDRSDRTLKWEVRSLPLLLARIVPHFRRYPMWSGKQRDFELFADVCQRMARREHRCVSGLTEIVRLAGRMNPSGKRGYLPEAILRSLVGDEGIVCPSGNRGSRRSSDLHEWRNDLGTVSTTDSAKLHYE